MTKETNEIKISLIINEKDINKEIYFLDNYDSCHDNLKELNELNTKIYIDNDEKNHEYKKYFKPKEKKEYEIKLKFNINLTDCSYMCAGCKNIKKITFINFNTKNVTDMKYMFYKCENLKKINNILAFDTKNTKNIDYMFYCCHNLVNLDLSSFDLKNIRNTKSIFCNCKSKIKKKDNNFDDNPKKDKYNIAFLGKNEIPKYSKIKKNDENFNDNPPKDRYKIVFVGESGTGAKTTLINRLNTGLFEINTNSTLSANYQTKQIKLKNNKKFSLDFWDTAGQERFRSLIKFFIKDSDCIIIGFDITHSRSFEEIQNFWFQISKDISGANLFYLIGNKIDLSHERKVDKIKARKYALENNMKYFEISCKTGEGIKEFFDDLVKSLVDDNHD